MKKMANETMNNTMPATPDRAMNFSFSIFLTRVSGSSSRAMMSTRKTWLVKNWDMASFFSPRMSPSILRMETLKMMSSAMPEWLIGYICRYC